MRWDAARLDTAWQWATSFLIRQWYRPTWVRLSPTVQRWPPAVPFATRWGLARKNTHAQHSMAAGGVPNQQAHLSTHASPNRAGTLQPLESAPLCVQHRLPACSMSVGGDQPSGGYVGTGRRLNLPLNCASVCDASRPPHSICSRHLCAVKVE